jgi:endothelin-converting enzyme/putative endopeptidase
MRKALWLGIVTFTLASGPHAQTATAPSTATERPLTALPYIPGLDVRAMDRTADPCSEFYRYACGGWQRQNPIPPDQSSWHVYGKLQDDNQRFLWGILAGLAKPPPRRTPPQQKIGDFFSACMDEAAVERHGAKPLHAWLAAIDRLRSKRDLPALLARLHRDFGDGGAFFGFTSNQDYADATQVIAYAAAGGLGLPDRDYYLKDDDKTKALRAEYVRHVARMLRLIGRRPDAADREAAAILALETSLAEASLTKTERRDPRNLFHKVDLAGLQALTPQFDWARYMRGAGVPGAPPINVAQPAFYRALDLQLATRSLDDVKAYLRWHTAHAMAPYLSSAFVDENFAFFSRTLRGIPQQRPRWKRCVALVDAELGEALGQEFVRLTFSPEQKARTLRMATQIQAAMKTEIESLDWMSPATKAKAQEKLAAMVDKIGYPDRWRDYGPVDILRHDFAGNVVRATRFETRRQLAKIGRPLDRGEWYMTPPTVNAYYDPQLNDIDFPAGVLQPPLYDPRMDDAPNYGNTGGTIGHELTHGFDDSGRQFDAHGNLVDWWTDADARQFEARTACIVEQYGQYTAIDDIRINSKLTVGEDVADLGGALLAWIAWKAQTAGSAPPARDGLTPEQRFFVGFGQANCENVRPEESRLLAVTDPHSPSRWRVDGVVANMPEFARAFGCRTGQPMAREKTCRVW